MKENKATLFKSGSEESALANALVIAANAENFKDE